MVHFSSVVRSFNKINAIIIKWLLPFIKLKLEYGGELDCIHEIKLYISKAYPCEPYLIGRMKKINFCTHLLLSFFNNCSLMKIYKFYIDIDR